MKGRGPNLADFSEAGISRSNFLENDPGQNDRELNETTCRPIRVSTFEIATIAAICASYLLYQDLFGDRHLDFANAAGPIALSAVLLASALRSIYIDPRALWTALFWFRIATTVYFGFGQLAPLLMNDFTKFYFTTYFDPSPQDLLKLNVIVAFGTLSTLTGAKLLSHLLVFRDSSKEATKGGSTSPIPLGAVFLLCGAAVKYGFVVPEALGWTTTVPPGALSMLANLSLAGIYLVSLGALRGGNRVAMFAVSLFVALDMATGLVMLTKGEMMLPAVVFAMAVLIHRLTPLRLTLTIAAFVLMFQGLIPVISQARTAMADLNIEERDVGLDQRFSCIRHGFQSDPSDENLEAYQGGYLRLSYASIGGLLVTAYEQGTPGQSLRLLPAVFVPRFLWPEKPLINLGQQMSVLVSGIDQSAMGVGLFFEAYWNLGWLGVPLLMIPFGGCLYLLSNYALRVQLHEDFIFMPALFMAMRVGASIDNHYVTQIGAMVQIVALHVILLGTARMARVILPSVDQDDAVNFEPDTPARS
ncbi:MAG: hypothetical protein AAGA88_01225 [Pseudomonadota bacterium]